MQTPIPAGAIRDTVERLVTARAYQRGLGETLWSRVTTWVADLIGDLLRAGAQAPGGRLVALAVVLLLAASVLGRLLMLAAARRRAAALAPADATAEELRARARALAGQAAWSEAAHVLHAAIVARLHADGHVTRHPSFTVGDYARALRRGDERRWHDYRAFARRYEIVAYGDAPGDAATWQALDRLAAPLLDGAAASVPTATVATVAAA